jgi:hypothetical protein
MISRKACIDLINAAHVADRLDFAHSTAIDWLKRWPGDLELQLLLAETELAQGENELAAKRLKKLIIADPLYARAYEVLSLASGRVGDPNAGAIYSACCYALQGKTPKIEDLPRWLMSMITALRALETGRPRRAIEMGREAVRAEVTIPLPTLIQVRALLASGDDSTAFAMVRSGHERWPGTLYFRLYLAQALLADGQASQAVHHLHQAAAEDNLGRTVQHVLGPDHPYRDLWPEAMTAELSRPVPAVVHIAMGENRLPGRSPSPAEGRRIKRPGRGRRAARTSSAGSRKQRPALPTPEPWEAFRGPDPGDAYASFNPDALEQEEGSQGDPALPTAQAGARTRREDDRVPAYVVLSSRTRISQTFGESEFKHIDEAIERLCSAVRRRGGWRAYKLYIDDPQTLKPFSLSPVDPANAWQIKLRLADLDAAMGRRGEMIGALLIVGGHRIIPYHMLPNPVDDDDDAIPSDNPYTITDDNYLAPEWPLGRLPTDNDPDLIKDMLDRASRRHLFEARQQGLLARVRDWLLRRFGRVLGANRDALGYSASIWRKASMAVFRAIGEPRELITSPPTQAGDLPTVAFRPTRFSYYNLHGLEDEPEWFGQRDPLRDEDFPIEFPIALEPRDVMDGGRAPRLVFSEACYGANVLGKTSETALNLKFMKSGTEAFVGSTKISYGSITPPLIAADLLGRNLWNQVRQGVPIGEALRRAKLELVDEMHARQGYLDGEDQKTLISFVLFGDPLSTPASGPPRRHRKGVIRHQGRPDIPATACALGGECEIEAPQDGISVQAARAIVARYLPGMRDSICRIRPQQPACSGEGHSCPSKQLGTKSTPSPGPSGTLVVTFERRIQEGHRSHAHFARLTVDRGGKMLKLAVSR